MIKIYCKGKPNRKSDVSGVTISDSILNELAPSYSILRTCLITASKTSISSPFHESLVYSFNQTLNWILTSPENHEIKKLLISKHSNLSALDVVNGFKNLEEIISYTSTTKRKDTISSNFRWFISTYGGEILDGISTNQCGFKTRFKRKGNNITDALSQSKATSTPYVIKSKKKKNKIEKYIYITIDPDCLNGLAIDDGLLSKCLTNLSIASNNKPEDYSTISSIKNALELIASSNNIDDIECLLTKPISLITERDVQLGFNQLEDIIHSKGSYISLSTKLRSFFNKWGGELFNGKKFVQSGFKSRFKNATNTLSCISPVYIHVTKKNKSGHPYSTYKIDTFNFVALVPPNSILSTTLNNLQIVSKETPISFGKIKKFEEILILISNLHRNKIRRLLIANPNKISQNIIRESFNDLENIIKKNVPKEKCYLSNKNFREILCNHAKLLDDNGHKFKFTSKFESRQKSKKLLQFKVKHKYNGVNSFSTRDVNICEIENIYNTKGLVGLSLHNAAASSWREPINRSTINEFWSIVKKISRLSDTKLQTLLTSSPEHISNQDLIDCFNRVEKCIGLNKKIKNKHSASNKFRGFLGSWSGPISNNLTVNQCRFSSQFKKEVSDKSLIEPLDINGESKPSPIIKRHASITELKNNISDYYNEAILQILDACNEEMDKYDKLQSDIFPLIKRINSSEDSLNFEYIVPNEVMLYTETFSEKLKTTDKTKTLIDKYGHISVLAGALQRRLQTPITSPFSFPGQSYLIPEYAKTWFPKAGATNDFSWTGTLLPRPILLVCFIRLTIFTTWNKDVIATLKPEDLPDFLPDGPFELQAFKEKVNKPTATVTIYPHEHEIRKVIGLLIKHVVNMKYLGMNPQTIWETKTSSHLTFLSCKSIRDFCARSSQPTPYFTLDQLAKHQINVRFKIDNDLEKSRQERNHSKIRTTAGYMSSPLARVEYEANNGLCFLNQGTKSSAYDLIS